MPRTLGTTLLTVLNQPVAYLVACWKITATDATELGFTSHTDTLTIGGLDYAPTAGIAPSTVEARTGLAVDNLEIQAILTSDLITEADIFAGRWDFAAVEVFLIDTANPTAGTIVLHRGTIGEVKTIDGAFVAQVRSLLQAAQQQIVALTTPTCRVRALGDSQCGVSLTSFTKTGTVDVVTSRRVFTVTGAASGQADHWFRYGTILFTSGANSGRIVEIKDNIGDTITLQLALPFDLESGDTATLIAGCDRSRSTCRDKYSNVVNFRGEPDIPGNDAMLKQASAA